MPVCPTPGTLVKIVKHYLCLVPMALTLCGCNVHKSSPVAPTPTASATAAAPADPPVTTTAYPSNGPDLIAYVAGKYPERLAIVPMRAAHSPGPVLFWEADTGGFPATLFSLKSRGSAADRLEAHCATSVRLPARSGVWLLSR